MPTYSYRCESCGCLTNRVRRIPQRNDPVPCAECGGTAEREMSSEMSGQLREPPGNWPMHSYAAGVSPTQREEAYEASVRMGVPTRFDKNGDAIFTSPHHRRKYCEAKGLFDRNAGHSDPKPQNR